MNSFLVRPFIYKGCVVELALIDLKGFVRLALIAIWLVLLAVATGCAGIPAKVEYKTVNVPIRVACVATIPDKPVRLTPCPMAVVDSECVKRAGKDIERLASAVDQLTDTLKACQ